MSSISDDEIQRIVKRVLNQYMGISQPGSAAPPPPAASLLQRPLGGSVSPEPRAPAGVGGTAAAPALMTESKPGERKVVAIGADHGGFELKELLKADLSNLGYDALDVGTNSKEAVDYPDFAHEVARLVGAGVAWRGIMIDGAGIGSCIVANKLPGVRAGMAYDYSSAVNSREHNDTNVLTLGAGLIGINLAKQIVAVWLATPFGGGRHEMRVNKIIAVEKQYLK